LFAPAIETFGEKTKTTVIKWILFLLVRVGRMQKNPNDWLKLHEKEPTKKIPSTTEA
jgi:hypothetical protein